MVIRVASPLQTKCETAAPSDRIRSYATVVTTVVEGGTAGSIFFGAVRRRFRLWWRTLGVFVCVRWLRAPGSVCPFVPSREALVRRDPMVGTTRLPPRCSRSISSRAISLSRVFGVVPEIPAMKIDMQGRLVLRPGVRALAQLF